ncbi:L,D-transpeptidase [Legionella israelensis]|nr:L,D-transpeptidase [Legionella israelensis]
MQSFAAVSFYSETLCKQKGFVCRKVEREDSWSSLFPKEDERRLVKRLNRMNGFLKLNTVIAVPKTLEGKSLSDFSPFPNHDQHYREKTIVVDQEKMAWAAYNAFGQLVRWGPISAGSQQCFDKKEGCSTPTGSFRIFKKRGRHCFSKTYPKRLSAENGGAYMPYCMFFYKGYALHGSQNLPGYHSSHGCVRLLVEDAKWLYQQFVDLPSTDRQGTKLIVLP